MYFFFLLPCSHFFISKCIYLQKFKQPQCSLLLNAGEDPITIKMTRRKQLSQINCLLIKCIIHSYTASSYARNNLIPFGEKYGRYDAENVKSTQITQFFNVFFLIFVNLLNLPYLFKVMHACVCACSVMSNTLPPHGPFVSPQGSLSMEFSRQECWRGLSFSTLGDLPNLGIEPASLSSPVLAGGFFTFGATCKALLN